MSGKANTWADMWLLYDTGMRIPVILETQEGQRGHRAMRLRLEGPRVAGIPRGMMACSNSQRIQIKGAITASHIKAVNLAAFSVSLKYRLTHKFK